MKQLLYLLFLSTIIFNTALAQYPENRYDMNINDGSKHIGEYKLVNGVVYKVETRHDKANPDSASVLFYLRDPKNPSSYLINIFRVNIKGNTRQANWFKNIKAGRSVDNLKETGNYNWQAEGKIFLFEGKPAILMDFDDLRILELVEK